MSMSKTPFPDEKQDEEGGQISTTVTQKPPRIVPPNKSNPMRHRFSISMTSFVSPAKESLGKKLQRKFYSMFYEPHELHPDLHPKLEPVSDFGDMLLLGHKALEEAHDRAILRNRKKMALLRSMECEAQTSIGRKESVQQLMLHAMTKAHHHQISDGHDGLDLGEFNAAGGAGRGALVPLGGGAGANGLSDELERELEEKADLMAEELEEEEESRGLSYKEMLIMFVLLFSLFFADAWDFCAPPADEDIIRNVIILFCFSVFLFEVYDLSVEEPGYFLATFFYLDIIGTVALLLDLSWIATLIAGSGGKSVVILRATRTSKLGIRSKEIFKLFSATLKLFRVVRIAYKAGLSGANEAELDLFYCLKASKKWLRRRRKACLGVSKVRPNSSSSSLLLPSTAAANPKIAATAIKTKQEENEEEDEAAEREGMKKIETYTEHQLLIIDDLEGKKREMTESFAIRLSAVVMIMIIIVPLLQYNAPNVALEAWTDTFRMLGKDNSTTLSRLQTAGQRMAKFYDSQPDRLISINMHCPFLVNGSYTEHFQDIHAIREDNVVQLVAQYKVSNELLLASALVNPFVREHIEEPDCTTCKSSFELEIEMNVTKETQQSALLTMMSTVLVIFILFFGTSSIVGVCESMVLLPLRTVLMKLAEVMQKHCPELLAKTQYRGHRPVSTSSSPASPTGKRSTSNRPRSVSPSDLLTDDLPQAMVAANANAAAR